MDSWFSDQADRALLSDAVRETSGKLWGNISQNKRQGWKEFFYQLSKEDCLPSKAQKIPKFST